MRRRSVLASQSVSPRRRPRLVIMRATDPPPLEYTGELLPARAERVIDSPLTALAIVISLLVGAVLIGAALSGAL